MNFGGTYQYKESLNKTDIEFRDIFDIEDLQRMQDLFSDATGVASIITLPDGSPLTQPSNFCGFCNLVRITDKGFENCLRSDKYSTGSQNNLPGPIIYTCLSAGLWDSAAPIVVDGHHLANWLIGQVRNEDLIEEDGLKYANEIGIPLQEYNDALQEVPTMSSEKFKKISETLLLFANEISQRAYSNYQLKIQNEILHKSEESLAITLQSIGDGVISTDTNGLIVNMNPIAEKLCGWKLNEARGEYLTKVFRIINSTTRVPVNDPVETVLNSGQIIELAEDTVLHSKDGSEYRISDSAAPIKTKAGEIIGVVLVFSDVTEKYYTQKAIRLNELKHKGLLDNLNAGVVVCAPDTSVIFSNKRASQIFNLTNEEFYHSNLTNSAWPLTNETGTPLSPHEYPVSIILSTKEPIRDQIIGIQKNKNNFIWLNVNGFPVMSPDSEITEIIFSFDDITKKKIYNDKLIDSEQFLKQTQLIVKLGTFTYDLISNKLTGSDLFNNILGIDINKPININGFLSIIHPDWQNSIANAVNEFIVEGKKRFDTKFKIIRESDHSESWIHGVGELIYNENGHPIKLIGTIQDITDQKLSEESLRMSEEKFRSFFNNVHDIFYQVNMDGIITEISPSLKYFSEFERDEIIGIPAAQLYDNLSDRDTLLKILHTNGELYDYEIDLKTKNGSIKHVSINCRLIYNSEGKPDHIDGAIRDITNRKKAELALKQNETFLRETQLIANLGTFNFDIQSGIMERSDIFNTIVGADNQTISKISTLKSSIHPDWKSEITNYFSWKIKESKKLFDIKFKIIRINDGQERWIHTLGKLTYDNDKKLIRVIGTIRDITDSKNSKEALKASKEQLKKFAAHLQNVREEERLVLAKEIHDKLGQILIALKIDLGMLKQNIIKTLDKSNAESILTKFDGVFQLVDNTINTTRKIMSDLRSEVLFMLGFVEAARLQIKNFQELNNIDCYFNNFSENLQLSPEQSVALFRVLQESLSNVAQHSKATLVKVRLETNNNLLSFEIGDNGIGLEESEKAKPGTYGFIEMEERIRLIKGDFQIESSKGNGTSIYVQIPIKNYSLQL
jgi:PAS domain S-box-containing protein